ncbi:hypothetical protein B0J15DRAFT_56571 [Fusarium solani]|uniref:Uncharacterized protein n=1 Tax=Fusarium solani TaxID=169388 RepID=A0A9P9K678_FUSSL|nr:uncharacterized protein B0J15DRAFT_56571 [Fusarium solani]KAH7249418.1 hypothetical protein B0J15DRAFT_56571 [Fusarium solani]
MESQLRRHHRHESHDDTHRHWPVNGPEGRGEHSNHIYGGVITFISPGVTPSVKDGKRDLDCYETVALQTPAEISTKKSPIRHIALPRRGARRLTRPAALPEGAVSAWLPPPNRTSASNTQCPARPPLFTVSFSPWSSGSQGSPQYTPPWKCQEQSTCSPRLLPRHPLHEHVPKHVVPAAIGADTSCLAASLADAVPWHPHRLQGGGVLLTSAPRTPRSSNHKP